MHSVSDGTSKQLKRGLFFCVLLAFLLIGGALMAEAEDANGVLRSRAYKFNNITSQRAQEILSQLKIGTAYDPLSKNVLIVTSNNGSDLMKATEVLSVLDQAKPVGIQVLLVGTDQQPLPNIDVLSMKLPTITVGTMTDAPPKGSKNPAILDVLNNKLIAIAGDDLLPEIQKAVDEWKKQNPPTPAVPATEPTESMIEQKVVTQQPSQTPAAGTEEKTTPAEKSVGEQTPQTQKLVPLEEAKKEVPQETSLEDIMSRLLAQEDTMPVPPPPAEAPSTQSKQGADLDEMLQTEPNSTEDYIGDELLRTLLEEEKKTQPKPEPVKPAVVPQPVPEPKALTEAKPTAEAPETGEEKSLQEAIRMLLGQQQATEPQQPVKVETQPAVKSENVLNPEQMPRSEAVSENLRLQRELALLRQQLAQAQAQKESPEGTVDIEEQAEEPAPKIITEKPANPTQFKEAISEKELETIIDLPQEVELENLVDLVGKQLGLNYMYDQQILKNQKVFLKINEGKIKVKDLYGLLESVLRFRGFVMTRRDNLVTIIKSSDANQVAAQVDTVFRMPGDPIQPGDIIVSTLFRLENIDTATAEKTLASMKLGLANGFQQIPETNTLIVTDYAYRMPRIEEVLKMIDVAGEEKVFKYYTLKYMQAADLVDKLKDLVSKMEGVSMQVGDGKTGAATTTPTRYTTQRVRNPQTGRIETKRVPVPMPNQPGQAAAAAGATNDETVFIDTDERTNRILMIGTESQIEIINQLIETLDVPQSDLKFVKEYVIQNVEAAEVVNVLNELGLASVSVSSTSSSASSAASARSAAAARAAAARGQAAPQPTPTVSPSTASKAGSDQPSIAIRPATNSLLVNGTDQQHQAIELVIAYVDVVQKDQRTIREYEIQYVDTQEIIDTMTELGMISPQSASAANRSSTQSGRTSSTSSRTSRTTQPQQPAAAEGGAPTMLPGFGGEEGSPEDITAQQPQIAVLEATNSLLVYATPRQHKAISLLIAHADRVPTTTTTPYVVYALENQDPADLAEVLTKLIQETVEETGKKSTPESKIQTSGAAATAAGGGNVPSLEEQKIRIIPDPMSYSLIVYANKRNQQWVSELITELDQYRPQVLLDCTLVEVTQNEKFEYDLDIISKTYGAANLRSGTDTGAPVGQLQSFTQDQFADARSTTSGDPVIKAFFNSANVQGLLTAIQTNGYGRVMARPKILVNDNQEGEIKTENQTSIAQQKSNIIPGTGTSNTITTTDVTFSDYTSGITLTIKPHISKGNMLRLEISLNRKDFDFSRGTDVTVADQKYPRPPDLLSTDVTTVATVPDGTTIIMGGLETIKQSKGNSKVPILGDLPLVGGLFRGVNDSGEQGKLYVFVKANILRPSDQLAGLEDIHRVSSENRKAFEEMEKKFQEQQDWPGVKPKPMAPAKVLGENDENPSATTGQQ